MALEGELVAPSRPRETDEDPVGAPRAPPGERGNSSGWTCGADHVFLAGNPADPGPLGGWALMRRCKGAMRS
jgi:hypothetical protein